MGPAASAAASLAILGLASAVSLAAQDPCDTIVIGHVVRGGTPEGTHVVIAPEASRPECARPRHDAPRSPFIPSVRPGLLADEIESFAGQAIRMLRARVVGVLEPHAFLVDSQSDLPPLEGHRARVLVFVEGATLRVEPSLLVGQTVTVLGVARTLLGMHVSAAASWPAILTPSQVSRLEIKAAMLARSVQTADGVELTTRAPDVLSRR